MNNVTQVLEGNLKSLGTSLYSIHGEALDIVKYYNSTTASTLVGALATNNTPATVTTALTKGQFVNMITTCTQLNNFFANSAVTTGDYLSNSENVINGSTPAGAVLSQDVEQIGIRLKALALILIGLKYNAADYMKIYTTSELLQVFLIPLSASTIVFGSSTSSAKFTNGFTLTQAFLNFMSNAAVSTADYYSLTTQWAQGA